MRYDSNSDIAFGRIAISTKHRVDGLGELIVIRLVDIAYVYPKVLYAVPPRRCSVESDLVIASLALASTIHQVSKCQLLRIRPYVCESIAYRGMLSPKSLVRLKPPPSLRSRRRIIRPYSRGLEGRGSH